MISLIELVKPEDRTPGRKKKATKRTTSARKSGPKATTVKQGEPKTGKGSAGS
jgi:hypothetical protein